jgi:hypothetical protein
LRKRLKKGDEKLKKKTPPFPMAFLKMLPLLGFPRLASLAQDKLLALGDYIRNKKPDSFQNRVSIRCSPSFGSIKPI